MALDGANPFLAAERVNDLVEYGTDYFRERLTKNLKALMQSGYLPLTLPPENPQEEFALTTERLPEFLAVATDESRPWGERQQAQQGLIRWMQLRQQLGVEP